MTKLARWKVYDEIGELRFPVAYAFQHAGIVEIVPSALADSVCIGLCWQKPCHPVPVQGRFVPQAQLPEVLQVPKAVPQPAAVAEVLPCLNERPSFSAVISSSE
jgi:hypothetical protein